MWGEMWGDTNLVRAVLAEAEAACPLCLPISPYISLDLPRSPYSGGAFLAEAEAACPYISLDLPRSP